MSGENTEQAQQPREQRQSHQSGGSKHDAEGGNQQRNRNRRSGGGGGGGRKGVYRFEDQLEHDICQLVTHSAPQGFPAYSRSEFATMPPVEVARTETRILLCDGRHEGPHIWPNGDELPEG